MHPLFDYEIFRKYPFFAGENNIDQLIKIVEVLGSEEILRFQFNYKSDLQEQFKVSSKVTWIQEKTIFRTCQ